MGPVSKLNLDLHKPGAVYLKALVSALAVSQQQSLDLIQIDALMHKVNVDGQLGIQLA